MGIRLDFLKDPNYDPNPLLDFVLKALDCKTDNGAATIMGVDGGYYHRARNRVEGVSGNFLLRIHEHTLAPVAELRKLMGVEGPPIKTPPQPVPAIVIHKVEALTRYWEANGKLWPDAVGRNGYVKFRDLIEILEKA